MLQVSFIWWNSLSSRTEVWTSDSAEKNELGDLGSVCWKIEKTALGDERSSLPALNTAVRAKQFHEEPIRGFVERCSHLIKARILPFASPAEMSRK